MIILIFILLNTVQMAIAYHGASTDYVKSLEYLNLAFTGIFISEAVLKIIGLTPYSYFKSNWNKFDFFVVVSSIVDIIMGLLLGEDVSLLRFGPQLIRMLRVLRVSRLIRIFKALVAVK